MAIQALDARFRSSLAWRAAGVTVCLWVAGVIGFAGLAAHSDGLELYRWTMLGLLLVGLPVAVGAVAYAAILLGQKGRKVTLLLIVLSGVAFASLQGYNSYQARVRAEEHRVAQLAEDAEMVKRAVAKEAQDSEDCQQFGATCTTACKNLGNYSKLCPAQCSQNRGDQIRRTKWSAEKASCATQCAADPNKYCDTICEMDRSGAFK